MGVIAISSEHREWVDRIIREEWAGPWIATRGKLLDTRILPGFVFFETNRIVGMVLYDVRGSECEVAVLISFWKNRGVGSALLDAAADAARERGCSRMWLITTNDNTHAIRYYQKRGFRLKAVHIGGIEEARRLKPSIPLYGIDGIPILHEFEFERPL